MRRGQGEGGKTEEETIESETKQNALTHNARIKITFHKKLFSLCLCMYSLCVCVFVRSGYKATATTKATAKAKQNQNHIDIHTYIQTDRERNRICMYVLWHSTLSDFLSSSSFRCNVCMYILQLLFHHFCVRVWVCRLRECSRLNMFTNIKHMSIFQVEENGKRERTGTTHPIEGLKRESE